MKKELILSAFLLAAGAAYAQNLNPVVEVTNVYAREATGIEKPPAGFRVQVQPGL